MDIAHDVTGLLVAWRDGDGEAAGQLFPLVYDELRALARRRLAGERPDHTLGATALVHEAYLKLVDQARVNVADRTHFFAVAARAMRQVLVDYARGRRRLKRGGEPQRVDLEAFDLASDARADSLVALDEALTRLAAEDERLARVVECRFFGGLTDAETGAVLGVTERTVRRDWVKAKAWLARALRS